jgi:SAM-dependent methyltransferase
VNPALTRFVRQALPLPLSEKLYAIRDRGVQIPDAPNVLKPLRRRHGLEIGGPSGIFVDVVPVYRIAGALDGANFADDTMWEGRIVAGASTFRFDGDRRGTQFVHEATALDTVPAQRYDFVISSNCLEHVANPIKALREWMRVIVPGGHLLLVLPRKESNFDHRRPITAFEHLLEDFERDVDEHDMTHLEQIVELHDFERDPPARNPEFFRTRSADNFRNRGLHHHVFDEALIARLFAHLGIRPLHAVSTRTDHIALGRLP